MALSVTVPGANGIVVDLAYDTQSNAALAGQIAAALQAAALSILLWSVDAGVYWVGARALGLADGVSDGAYWAGAVSQAPDGTVFFGGLEGITVVAPGASPLARDAVTSARLPSIDPSPTSR